MAEALYGHSGFYRRPEGPRGHFRTSPTAGSAFAAALLRLAAAVDATLGHPGTFDLVDVGAGRGELLVALFALSGQTDSADRPDPVRPTSRSGEGWNGRLRLRGVDVVSRPAGLPAPVDWSTELPETVTGMVVANEYLDDVPLDVVVATPDGPRQVLVDRDGRESLDGAPSPADHAWLNTWWPLDRATPGDRAEVGRSRDEAWVDLLGRLTGGLVVAVDYSHARAERVAGRFCAGTLTGFRAGRQVPAVPDGSCNLTAHVALDSCADAGRLAGASATLITTQRLALRALGLDPTRPPLDLARRDPQAYLRQLQDAGDAGELMARGGLGDFGWLVQTVAMPMPELLA